MLPKNLSNISIRYRISAIEKMDLDLPDKLEKNIRESLNFNRMKIQGERVRLSRVSWLGVGVRRSG